MASTSLDYLVPRLRLELGDIDATQYRYLDEWLDLALLVAVETLQNWWNFRYLIDTNDEVYRNPNSSSFWIPEPPVIQVADVRPIILMASIVIKAGDLQNISWNVGVWRDSEISYSNIEGSRGKQQALKMAWEELTNLLSPPTKKLSFTKKAHLPGYKNNPFEYD